MSEDEVDQKQLLAVESPDSSCFDTLIQTILVQSLHLQLVKISTRTVDYILAYVQKLCYLLSYLKQKFEINNMSIYFYVRSLMKNKK